MPSECTFLKKIILELPAGAWPALATEFEFGEQIEFDFGEQSEFEFGHFETTRPMLLAHSLNPHNLKIS